MTTKISETTIKLKGQPKIYLNSLVNNAAHYFSQNTKPLEAEIVDAYFEQHGEMSNVIEGLWNYCNNNRINPHLGSLEKEHIHKMYADTTLSLFVREKESKKYSWIKINNLNDITDHLGEIGREELDAINKGTHKLSDEEKAWEERIWNEKRDSCIPLIHRKVHIYRQLVNGQDVIGFSKAYNDSNKVSSIDIKKDAL